MSNCKVETGYQLFTRLNTTYDLDNIYPELIPNLGPRRKEVIEITGDTSTGKTFIITEIIAKCILPSSIDEIRVGGKNAGAVILNTDHHFSIFKLVLIMENILSNCKLTQTRINDVVNESLRNLIILNCYDSYQFHITIHNLENIFSSNNRLALLVLDSISAYYWSDRVTGGARKMDLYLKNILKLLQNATKEYNTVIVFTKYTDFSSKKDYVQECCNKPTPERINYRIFLRKNSEENGYIAHITLPDNKIFAKQYIIKDVIHWID